MLGVKHLSGESAKSVANRPVGVKLFLEPERASLAEGSESSRRNAEVCLENPFEFQKGLVIEDNRLDIVESCLCLLQAEIERERGKRVITFFPCEALLLSRGDNCAVAKERRRAVMVEGRNSKQARLGQTRLPGFAAEVMREKGVAESLSRKRR
jgi:hypothetical protein